MPNKSCKTRSSDLTNLIKCDRHSTRARYGRSCLKACVTTIARVWGLLVRDPVSTTSSRERSDLIHNSSRWIYLPTKNYYFSNVSEFIVFPDVTKLKLFVRIQDFHRNGFFKRQLPISFVDCPSHMGVRLENRILRSYHYHQPARKWFGGLPHGHQSIFAHFHQHLHLEFGDCRSFNYPPHPVDYSNYRSLPDVHSRRGSNTSQFYNQIVIISKLHFFKVICRTEGFLRGNQTS